MRVFSRDELMRVARERAPAYRSAAPFPHAVIDDLFDSATLEHALAEFPRPGDLAWYKYDNALEKKLAMPHLDRLPPALREILIALNTPEFVSFVGALTGIQGLLPDPEYVGGGLHQIERGGKIDVHADFNYHPNTKLDRRVNVLVFLNREWREEYRGHLELWDREMNGAVQRVLPVFNRTVVFDTTDFANHGHPEPLACPEGWTRKSIALYYYSSGRPDSERSAPHSTIYKRRPADAIDPEIEALRAQRSKGRLQNMTTQPKRILLTAFGSRGDVVPRVALGRELQLRGHRATIACVENYRAEVESRGLEWTALGAHPPDDVHSEAYARIMAQHADPGARGEEILRELFLPMIPGLLERVAELEGGFDLVVVNDMLASFTLPPFIAHQRLLLTLTAQPVGGFAKVVGQSPCTKLVGSSPLLLPEGHRLGPDFEVTDFWLLDESDRAPANDALARFLEDGGDPIVAVTLATAWGRDARLPKEAFVAAAKRAGVRLVVQDFSDGLEGDDRVLSIGSIPYAWLFARVSAVLHHGGAGTIAEALRARRPSIVLPQYGDHPYWARRLEDAGVSAGTLLPDQVGVDALARHMVRAVHDPELRENVERLGARIDPAGGLRRAVDRIERAASERAEDRPQ